MRNLFDKLELERPDLRFVYLTHNIDFVESRKNVALIYLEKSEAYKKSEEEKGRADAEASRIYAEAYAKDPEFYVFWKSLESYKTTMKNFDSTFSTNMDYFKYLYADDGKN